MRRFTRIFSLLIATVFLLALSGCGVSRFIPEGEYLLDKVAIKCDSQAISTASLQGFVRQHPNSRWFTLWRAPMLPYMIMGNDTTKRFNKFLMRIGEKPVICDTTETERTRQRMESAVRNMGYLDAEVETRKDVKKKNLKLTYQVHPRQRYTVSSIRYDIRDSAIALVLDSLKADTKLYEGMPFDANVLDQERSRINKLLHNHGYYRFNREFITYKADTISGSTDVNLVMHLAPYATIQDPEPKPHRQYRIGSVTCNVDTLRGSLRPKVIGQATRIHEGNLYREQDLQSTYEAFGRLGAVMSTNVRINEQEEDSTLLDCNIHITNNKPHSVSMEVEGTNTAGDLGAAVAASYQNRNLFKGSEMLMLKLRGAYENVRGLEGYDDQDYIEYSAEARLTFPDFKFPFFSAERRANMGATSEVSLMYDSQNRPEFHRRVVTGAWRYKWKKPGQRMLHRVDLLDLNYVYMPWISETFRREYLDDPSNRNAILRYNYENLFIMKAGYQLSFTNAKSSMDQQYGSNAYSIRFNIESSGNLLYGISNALRSQKDNQGHYNIFNIAYAQYAKGDFDFSRSFRFDSRNSLAVHFGLGIAYPYGNSTILPYEKRYFSGGANSVRGWSVRGLGPGSFKGTDGRIDFINQTGDVKLDMNMEYRTHMFWKLDGAVFLDAGNIWTIRNYADQPGGQFHFDTFWRQIAVAYGVGLRLNFTYFILRLDGGMKAINPAYTDARHHYPIIHPNFKRDFSLHFAVGLPF